MPRRPGITSCEVLRRDDSKMQGVLGRAVGVVAEEDAKGFLVMYMTESTT